MKKMMRVGLVMCFVIANLVGCASAPTRNLPEPKFEKSISGYVMESFTAETANPTDKEFAEYLETAVQKRIRAKKLFSIPDRVPTSEREVPGLSIHAKIVELSKVSGFMRIMFGAFAGQASALTEVEVIDHRSNRKLASFTIDGRSDMGSIFAGTTSLALDRTADQIVKLLKEHGAGNDGE